MEFLWQLVLLFIALLISVCFIQGTDVLQHRINSCPESCTCVFESPITSVMCRWRPDWETTLDHLIVFVQSRPTKKAISFHEGLIHIPWQIHELGEDLVFLDLSSNRLSGVKSGAFSGLEKLESLDLSYNSIQNIQSEAFQDMPSLQMLNISTNRIASLSRRVFQFLPNLQVLNLQNNMLTDLPQDIFRELASLEILDLGFNRLSFLYSGHLKNLTKLRELHLQSNKFQTFHGDLTAVLTNIPLVDLSNNPFDCSCAIAPLKSLLQSKKEMFKNRLKCHCLSPARLAGKSIVLLKSDDLNCIHPNIAFISDLQTLRYQGKLVLPCEAAGLPIPAIVWEVPWGDRFANKEHYHLLGDISTGMRPYHSYQARNLELVSHVSISESGALTIDKFRGYFVGNFTCIAINPLGNDSAVVEVQISSEMRYIYYQSLLFSAYSSGGVLVLGIIVGVIRVIVIAIKNKLQHKKKSAEAVTVMEIEVETPECDRFEDDSDSSPPKSPLTSPLALTPDSPVKCTTPTGDSPQGWLPVNIFETLDEARWRLRYGVGRKMEKVRSHVQSIRESSTLYMQSIKESGSTAANRVKAGVVMSVETIKYGAQSIREFCWTGDMGGQTISMVSVSTDIDTQQTTEVVLRRSQQSFSRITAAWFTVGGGTGVPGERTHEHGLVPDKPFHIGRLGIDPLLTGFMPQE